MPSKVEDDSDLYRLSVKDESIGLFFIVSVTEAARIKMGLESMHPMDAAGAIACDIHDKIEARRPMFPKESYNFDADSVATSLEDTLAAIHV